MKKSEQLRKESMSEENDFRAMAISTKALREDRAEKFAEDWWPKIKSVTNPIECNDDKYSFEMPDIGRVDFYPKANKLLIRKKNKWVKPGLRFIIRKLNLA